MYSINVELNTIEQVRALCDICNEFEEDTILSRGRYQVDAKSIMGLMSVGLGEVDMISLNTNDLSRWDEFKTQLSAKIL